MATKPLPRSLVQAAAALEGGVLTSRELVEACLATVEHSAGARAAYLAIDAEGARARADQADLARLAGRNASPYEGVPISIKDNFDVQGQVTTAGSIALADQPAAEADADCLARLRRAGFIFLGRTHMTEFAYSGLGLNVHFPDQPRISSAEGARVPGGSSSGAAISVAAQAALAAIGTDTGGSCRIPAAFNGLVGFKPTASRVSLHGCVPLSPSLDSVGSIARTVECCSILDQFLSGGPRTAEQQISPDILVPTNFFFDRIEAVIADRFEASLGRLAAAGFKISRTRVAAFDLLPDITAQGGIVALEAYRYHAGMTAKMPDAYDPRVLKRIMVGAQQDPKRLADLKALRRQFVAAMEEALAGFACLAAPTVPVVAPLVTDCWSEEGYTANNQICLRNPSVANLMDGCSISLPMPGPEPSAGLMLTAPLGRDAKLLSIARAVEAAVKTRD